MQSLKLLQQRQISLQSTGSNWHVLHLILQTSPAVTGSYFHTSKSSCNEPGLSAKITAQEFMKAIDITHDTILVVV